MVKSGISQKRSVSSKRNHRLDLSNSKEWHPTKELLDTKRIGARIMECLLNNDPEGAMEIVEIYLDTVNRVQMAKNSRIPRSTLYHSLKHKNPTIKTLAKLMHASVTHKVA
jgi:DNA-binding phage protein